MFVSNSKNIFREFERQSLGQPLVWAGAFSPAAIRHAAQLTTNPAYARDMMGLDSVVLRCGSQMNANITADTLWDCFGRNGRENGVNLSQIIPGDGPDKGGFVDNFAGNINAVFGCLKNGEFNYINFWTYTGQLNEHNHHFPVASFIIAGRGTLLAKHGEYHGEYPANSIGLTPAGVWHKSPEVPNGKLRFYAAVFKAG